jgi:hypothetical protein
MVAGGVALAAMLVGAIRFDPGTMTAAVPVAAGETQSGRGNDRRARRLSSLDTNIAAAERDAGVVKSC